MTVVHGANIGYGFVKYAVIDSRGQESVGVFPAILAPARAGVAGALDEVPTVEVRGRRYWVGEDALMGAHYTLITQERLQDEIFIPAMVAAALERLMPAAARNGASPVCVTGLPATWAQDPVQAKLLGSRLRDGYPGYGQIRVIAEPLGMLYSVLLDAQGKSVGDSALLEGQVAVVDIGHHTVDICVANKGRPVADELDTWPLGTHHPLNQIRSRLGFHTQRDLSLYETDLAVRTWSIKVAGKLHRLEPEYAQPLRETGQQLASRLKERWQRGTRFDAILIGGGGAALEPLTDMIKESFPQAYIVPEPQTAIARGYARLARRLAEAQG